MSKPLRAFGLALAGLFAFAALSASSASALSWTTGQGSSFFIEKESTNFIFTDALGLQFTCTGVIGNGEFETSTSGRTVMQLTGCSNKNGVKATTPGYSEGTIVPNKLRFELVYLDAAKTKYGILLKPYAGTEITTFTLGSGHHVWTGGLIGEAESPKLNVKTTELKLGYATAPGIGGAEQQWHYIEESPANGYWNIEDSWLGGGYSDTYGMNGTLKWKMTNGAGEFLP